ncbi:MAG: hypothetical protein RDV48_01585 [Candidatus Eremiobacteraeota bacterium]|nr:hypothetical protein [Candidatus Eremiobacteraeota bacterium]
MSGKKRSDGMASFVDTGHGRGYNRGMEIRSDTAMQGASAPHGAAKAPGQAGPDADAVKKARLEYEQASLGSKLHDALKALRSSP